MAGFGETLKQQFKKLDTENTGLISKADLETLLKKLQPDFNVDDLGPIFAKLKATDDKVKYDEFVDLLVGKNQNLNPALAKPPSEELLKEMKDAFSAFDKDASGHIDLKELSAMCSALGKNLPDTQAAAAMQQLDKNGDMRCDFEEFKLWYTSTPNLGGYSHVALGFMKGKLKMEGGFRKLKKRAKKGIESIDDFACRLAFDLSPDMTNSTKEACSANLVMRKAEAPTNAMPRLVVKLTAKDADSAASIVALMEFFTKNEKPPIPLPPTTITQEKEKIVISMEAAPGMFDFEDEDFLKGISFLEDCAKNVNVKVTSGTSFQDALANPNRPLLMHFDGLKIEGDVKVGLSSLISFFQKASMPAEQEAALKVIALFVKDSKIVFNKSSIMVLAAKFKSMYKDDWRWAGTLSMLDISMGSLAAARTKNYSSFCEGGAIVDGQWSSTGPPLATKDKMFGLVREMANIASIDEIAVDGIPGSTVQFAITFDKVNPFPVLNYLVGSYPKNPDSQDANLNRPQSDTETERLKAAFDKFDKDKSGAIDLKELKDMIVELGGKITDEQLKEAMDQLDTNKDGTCGFDEFKALWSSKSNLGGYGSASLAFLKAKIAAGSWLERGKQMLSGASGSVGLPSEQDNFFKYTQEVSPNGVEELKEKMSIKWSIDQTDVKAVGTPSVVLTLRAKSAGAAGEIQTKWNALVDDMGLRDMGMGTVGTFPELVVKAEVIEISLTAPEGMVDQFYEPDLMTVVTPLIKSLKESNVQVSYANDFDDFLGKPDTPVTEVFAGAKASCNLIMSSTGKNILLNAMPGFGVADGPTLQLFAELCRLIAGADISQAISFHPEHISKLIKSNDMFAAASTPSGMKSMLASNVPPPMMDDEDLAGMAPGAHAAMYIVERLDSIESAAIKNIDLPVEFAANGLPANVGVNITCGNVKPFALLKYMLEPCLEKIPASNAMF